jgi:hypothetical protein
MYFKSFKTGVLPTSISQYTMGVPGEHFAVMTADLRLKV